MLVNNQLPGDVYRHNYLRIAFMVGALVLFIGHVGIYEFYERGNTRGSVNGTWRAEDRLTNDITPSGWVYRSLNAFNYLWQLSWLLYSLTFIYRRTSAGYLYMSAKTLSPIFYVTYIAGFLIQTIWLYFFQKSYLTWTWAVYLASFLLLSFALFIINNNVAVNKKIYETEGFNRDVWCLRFFAQNGVAFFACWTAVRFILALAPFLQIQFALSIANAGSISLALAGIIAFLFFFGSNFNAALVEKCAYQFSPWFVFIVFFWGVVENNWTSTNLRRNSIIAAGELAACVILAIGALLLFTMRHRSAKIDPIV